MDATGRRAEGLYDPAHEHDACGVAFVADIAGRRDHRTVSRGLTALINLEHRGARGAEPETGDGAGILIQVPDGLYRPVLAEAGVELPAAGRYAVGNAFLPVDGDPSAIEEIVGRIAGEEGLEVLAWRELPVDPDRAGIGPTARAVMPRFRQLFVGLGRAGEDAGVDHVVDTPSAGGSGEHADRDAGVVLTLERRAFALRKRVEHETRAAGLETYFPSLSGRTVVYKGMLAEEQLEPFFADLADERTTSSIALVHSRFSTNTFPAWSLAHPYRYLAHNGEINTLRGNRNWMAARESMLATGAFGEAELDRLFPIVTPDASDSATFDEVLELLHLGGRTLPHAVLMMIPEAWENHAEMDPARRAFYRYHSTLMEAWDGPALAAFTDGSVIGAVLDRNGLRPARYWVTEDGLVVLGSEVGVLEIDPTTIVRKGRLEPGRMFLVDTVERRIVDDDEIKGELAAEHPYDEWLHAGMVELADLPVRERVPFDHDVLVRRQQTFGYTSEEVSLLLRPMATGGAEATGSMGNDAPLAPFSSRSRVLFDYFIQLFAQVTNPPLDAYREELVTSLQVHLGSETNLLDASPASCRRVVLPLPVIDDDELAQLVGINDDGDMPGFAPYVVSGLYPVAGGGDALRERLTEIREEVSTAVADGARVIVLSDRNSDADHAPIPSLLLTGAVHHHLVREKTRTRVDLVVEAGDVRETHHVSLLLGYGASAVNPYLALDSVDDLIDRGVITGVTSGTATRNVVEALAKGVRKVMSKMGVSTVSSYVGAQIFEAIGLGPEVVDDCFAGTTSRLGGVGYDVLAEEVAQRHRQAWPADGVKPAHRELAVGGEYQWRREGELHVFNPHTVFKLQHSTRTQNYDTFKEYTRAVDEQSSRLMTLRGLFDFKAAESVGRTPVPIDEVEPVSEIVKRFNTGAISYGSISQEMHEVLAIAMNRLGGRSNTGEGGEDPNRFTRDANGDSRRSAVKQVASGRFGVTSEYLVNADDIQIKIAQGAKPGEGGQLPGHKVYPWIAKTRYSTPGVGLISPPPHHDIYSIEDIAQLIHDLKNANPRARIHVKLVSQVGVGTVAAGVSKAHADVVLISGHDGGTGASPLSSIKHAGGPWELGLAETQQTLLANGLRDRIVVQTDGQLKTGRDVVIAALLGAEEYGFATAPLVVSGCIMMRVCHLDTCPVGVATQNPVLRQKFDGKAEYVVAFMEFIAQEVREHLAALGFRSLSEAIGRTEVLDTRAAESHWKAEGLDLSPILHRPADIPDATVLHQAVPQDHGMEKALDHTLIQLAEGAIADGTPVRLELPVRNVNRTVGTMLGSEVTRRWGGQGLPDDTIDITFTGSGGQSFGAFLPRGVTMRLIGDTNDYFGKGLSGGRLSVRPHPQAPFVAEQHIVAGNVILYGATAGEAFLRGKVGERFCVRNSGAVAVVEGVGDHGCEYMTGGRAVILGPTGRNFAAGMSGGIAYVLDLVEGRVNHQMVELEVLDAHDLDELRPLVEKHYAATDSAVAHDLLTDWDTGIGSAAARFTKVMPTDFKRVLEATADAERNGRDVNEAIMEAARG
ncbi:glutamate synthase large subunit [Actinomycetospora cinnamomea]|uniref:Glutamate synthase domain-containing protein 2 n=1 Tax=Actinomycetospora cinnamomea TaxID=663609 RepID=A0A2U1FPX7_9PSEU|nr:glutamate synthase large subunit [Actinomycetospora cinnamomea]PVZ14196.1 glutamate synthase domain-containing protein 2 [Actinomycetospora cinnamomea]